MNPESDNITKKREEFTSKILSIQEDFIEEIGLNSEGRILLAKMMTKIMKVISEAMT